jgi:hypothetical protein
MNKTKIKNILDDGSYNIVATIPLKSDYFENSRVPASIATEKLRKAIRTLNCMVNENVKLTTNGVQELFVHSVETRTEIPENFILVDSLEEATVVLEVEAKNKDGVTLKQEVNAAKAKLTNIVIDANRIATKASLQLMTTENLNKELKNCQFPKEVRQMLGSMRDSEQSIEIDGETLSVGGFQRLSQYCEDGNVMVFNDCVVLSLGHNGMVYFDLLENEAFSLKSDQDLDSLGIEVDRNSLDYFVLVNAFARSQKLSIEVSFSEHLVNEKKKAWLVQIVDRQQLINEILKKLADYL